MQQLYYELSVLAKAVHFKNLSAAALHVGLSQPQLSRIVARLEDEFKIVLLDRSAKRKSSWTAAAFELSQIFENSNRRLEQELQSISHNQVISELKIGTLEGLVSLASKLTALCFEKIGVKKITLDIFDLSELEVNFLAGDLDLIVSSKRPGRQKFKYWIEVGHQQLQKVQSNRDYSVLSSFEHRQMDPRQLQNFPHVLVSNSLSVRKDWFNTHGGTGFLPTEPKRGKQRDQEPVFLIGSETLNPQLWPVIEAEIQKGDFF